MSDVRRQTDSLEEADDLQNESQPCLSAFVASNPNLTVEEREAAEAEAEEWARKVNCC